jgi:hypothetical protein
LPVEARRGCRLEVRDELSVVDASIAVRVDGRGEHGDVLLGEAEPERAQAVHHLLLADDPIAVFVEDPEGIEQPEPTGAVLASHHTVLALFYTENPYGFITRSVEW